jgi:hypothetical protein
MPKRKTRSVKSKTKRRNKKTRGFRAFKYTAQIFPMRMKAQDVSHVEDDTELRDLQQDCDAIAFYLNDRFYRMDMEALMGLVTGPDLPADLSEYQRSEDLPEFGRQGIVYPCAKHEGAAGGLASVNREIALFNFGAIGMPQAVCELGDIMSIVKNPDTSARVFQLVDTKIVIPAIASWKAVNHAGNYPGGAGLACTVGPVKLYRVIAARLGSRPDRKNVPRDGPKCSIIDSAYWDDMNEWIKNPDVKEREVKHREPEYGAPGTILDEIRAISDFATTEIDKMLEQMTATKRAEFHEFIDRYNKLPSDIKYSTNFVRIMDASRDDWQSKLKMGQLTPVLYASQIGLEEWAMDMDETVFDQIIEADKDDMDARYPKFAYPAEFVTQMDAKFGRSGWQSR